MIPSGKLHSAKRRPTCNLDTWGTLKSASPLTPGPPAAIGNFAAHPIKSKHTGEVLPVEPGEAEWNLDVLESLFDFYYVQPATLKAKKDALSKKLKEAGKSPVR